MNAFDQSQLSGTNPVVLELIKKLKAFEEAAAELDAAEQELEDVLASLFTQHSDEEVAEMLDQIGEQTELNTEPFKPQTNESAVSYIG